VVKKIWFDKKRFQKSTEIRTGCQRNAYWLATNHLSNHGLCSQSRSFVCGGAVCRKGLCIN